MSRAEKPVVHSIEDAYGERCIDFIVAAAGTVTFKEFRRDPEDAGKWTLVGDCSAAVYPCEAEATTAALARIPWLAPVLANRKKSHP